MNDANKHTSLTHRAWAGDHNVASASVAMHTSASLRAALAADRHSGQGVKLEALLAGMPLYMDAKIE
jgi:hypothetical protein